MSWNATNKEVLRSVADGEYEAILRKIEDDESKHGTVTQLEFTITSEGPWKGRVVIGIASKKLTANTKLGRWIAALLCGMPRAGDDVSEEAILDRPCRVVVKQRCTNDTGIDDGDIGIDIAITEDRFVAEESAVNACPIDHGNRLGEVPAATQTESPLLV